MKKVRRSVQLSFLALVLVAVFVVGSHCERWCPFGGVEAIYTYASEGNMLCSLSTSNFFILGGVLAMTLLLRRAFCGYICPIGAVSEWLRTVGRWLHVPTVTVAPHLDRTMAMVKYVVLVAILVATWRAGELIFRGFDPCYALISRHGVDITVWAYVVSAAIVLTSLVLVMPFCRWLCPLAAVLNPFSRFGLARVKRDGAHCIDCGRCSESCPTAIPVDQCEQVTAARCMSCLNCVVTCPRNAADAGALVWGPPNWLGRQWSQAVLVAVMLTCTTAAVAASYLFPMPSFVKSHGDPTPDVAKVRLEIADLTCRGRANLLVYFLERDDLFEIPGYFKIAAWPGPGLATVDIWYSSRVTGEEAIKQAITEPYYDAAGDFWRSSPFEIRGYDPFLLDSEDLLPGIDEPSKATADPAAPIN